MTLPYTKFPIPTALFDSGLVNNLVRSAIPSTTISPGTIILGGYTAAGDHGAGAIYTSVGAGPTGPLAIQDAAGTWFQLVISGPTNIGFFGAKMNGVTDDSIALNLCLSKVNQAWIPPNVSVGLGTASTPILVRSNQAIIGSGPTSKIVPLNPFDGVNFIDIAGDEIVLKDFAIISTQPDVGHESNHALIQNAINVSNLRVSGITIDIGVHRTSFLNLINIGGVNITDVVVDHCNILSGSGGMTIFTGSGDFAGLSSNILITDNYFANGTYFSGSPGGSGVSLSSHIKNCVVSNNIIGNMNFCCVELVGPQDGISIIGNTFFGATTPASVSSSNVGTQTNVLIAGNVCSSDFGGRMGLGSCPGAVVCNNVLTGQFRALNSNMWFHDNLLIMGVEDVTWEGIGLWVDARFGAISGCVFENNIVDATGSSGFFTMCAISGASASNNVIRNNQLNKAAVGGLAYTQLTASATEANGNLFYGNTLEPAGELDTWRDTVTPATNYAPIFDLQRDGASVFRVLGTSSTAGPNVLILANGIQNVAPANIGTPTLANTAWDIGAATNGLSLNSGMPLAWSNSSSSIASLDAGVSRSAAGVVAVGNGTQGNATAQVLAGSATVSGDPGGTASTNTLSGINSTTISTGVGSIKMSSANPGTNTGWLKCYIGTQVAWIPCWTTNAP